VDQVFVSNDLKEKGWKVVVRKEPCGRQVIDKVQIDLTKFDMFKLENDDAYVGLQAPISFGELVQLVVIVICFIVAATYWLLMRLMDGKMMEQKV
jgi:hypothetical protein